MELLEGRQLMAADIQGIVYHDVNNNGTVEVGEARLNGVLFNCSWTMAMAFSEAPTL